MQFLHLTYKTKEDKPCAKEDVCTPVGVCLARNHMYTNANDISTMHKMRSRYNRKTINDDNNASQPNRTHNDDRRMRLPGNRPDIPCCAKGRRQNQKRG